MTPTQMRGYFRGDTVRTILGGYLVFGGILTVALLVMKVVIAIHALHNVLPAAW